MVFALGRGEQPRHRVADGLASFADTGAQEHPATLAPAAREPRIAKDGYMAGNTRLALPQHLRQLAHRQLHRR